MGSIGSTELVLESPADAKLPFLVKAVKEVYKMFVDEDPSAFGKLKECKGTPLLTPCSTALTLLPEIKDFSSVFSAAKLKPDAGSFQLKEIFPKIPNNLITDEHQA